MQALPQLSLPLLLGLGFVLGMKHSLEADHLLAVGTLVARAEHRGLRRAAALGAWWGLGHTATLLGAGGLIIVLHLMLQRELPTWIDAVAERAVAAMLIVLGLKALSQGIIALVAWRQGEGHICAHVHPLEEGAVAHAHFHRYGNHACALEQEHTPRAAPTPGEERAAAEVALHPPRKPSQQHAHDSFWVGMVHGLAGSGSLVLLVLTALPHPAWALAFIMVFGLGSVGGMSAVTALFAWSVTATERLGRSMPHLVQTLAGAASFGFGLHLLYAAL